MRRLTEEQKQLVNDNIGLAYSVANKYSRKVSYIYDYDEVLSICFEALTKAAIHYDKEKNIKFSTFAFTAMKNELFSLFTWQLNKTKNVSFISLDEPQTNDEETLSSVIPQDYDLEHHILQNEKYDVLYKHIYELPIDMQEIVLAHLRGLTFKQIAHNNKKSIASIYKQYQKALNLLRYKFKGDRHE